MLVKLLCVVPGAGEDVLDQLLRLPWSRSRWSAKPYSSPP